MRTHLTIVAVLLSVGCAADLPTAPTRSTAVGTVTVTATPTVVLLSGSSVQLQATVLTTDGVRRPGVPVRFSTSAGTLSTSEQTTDANGDVVTTLTASSSATVTVTAEDKTERVSVSGVAPFTVEIQPSADAIVYTDQWMAQVAVTLARDAINPPRPVRVTLDCGNGTSRTLDGFVGVNPVPCRFGRAGTFTVRATATAENGWTTSGSRQVTAVDRPLVPMDVTLTGIEVSRNDSGSTWEFTAHGEPYQTPPVRWEWDFGDGHRDTSTRGTVQYKYTSRGIRRVTVRITTAGGVSGVAANDYIVSF